MVVVIVLLAVMTALVVSNSLILNHLRQELRLLDRQQQKRFDVPPPR